MSHLPQTLDVDSIIIDLILTRVTEVCRFWGGVASVKYRYSIIVL